MNNNDVIRIICPPTDLPKDERVKSLFKEIDRWISSDALKELVELFDGEIPDDLTLKEKIDWLNNFADIWDYRKKQLGGGERWSLNDDTSVKGKEDRIDELARILGVKTISYPIERPNYILPLGGARMSNYDRPKLTKEVVDNLGIHNSNIICLSGRRPINEIEYPYLEKYAPESKDEFEALSTGMEKVFKIKPDYNEIGENNENPNLSWMIRDYKEEPNGNRIYSLAAPSSDQSRRANSRDTFEFFLDYFDVKKNEKILLITSCVYVPFQLLCFMDLALEQGFYVDCIGVSSKKIKFGYVNTLQEIKAAINQTKRLADKYL